MASSRPLNDEEIRVLRAVCRGHMQVNGAGRYVIEGGPRPERKARASLQRRGLIDWPGSDGRSRITSEGTATLAILNAPHPEV